MGRVAAVVLAAGEASRFGAPKQALLLPEVLARIARSEVVDEVVVVEGAHPVSGAGASRVVRCDDWSLGPGA
jgi:CTP:molybdopterin cytidylyltransferase MocA